MLNATFVRRLFRATGPTLLAAALTSAALGALLWQETPSVRRFPLEAPFPGLPRPEARWAPYHANSEHVLNRIFQRTFLNVVTPEVVGGALPSERDGESDLAEGWMLAWRDGELRDSHLFGGDGRQLPRDGFTESEATELAADLQRVSEADVSALLEIPALAVHFQHDLLRLAQRLLDTGNNTALVPALFGLARRVALPREVLEGLHDPLQSDAPASSAVEVYQKRGSELREVLRRSTRLFDAARTLLWSRLYLRHPESLEQTELLISSAAGGAEVVVPIGTQALLVQGIVALDVSGEPVATPLVADLRLQTLMNRSGLAAANPTSSRDGVDFVMLQVEREGLRRADLAAYRIVHDDEHDLFRDYGTLKHTTYRAQCALCHRTTRTPEPHLGGFPVLRASAQPQVATSGTERLRLAEDQVRGWLAAQR